MTELAYEVKLKCRMCGYRTKGFQDHLAALTEMSNHLVYCLRLFEDDRAEMAELASDCLQPGIAKKAKP